MRAGSAEKLTQGSAILCVMKGEEVRAVWRSCGMSQEYWNRSADLGDSRSAAGFCPEVGCKPKILGAPREITGKKLDMEMTKGFIWSLEGLHYREFIWKGLRRKLFSYFKKRKTFLGVALIVTQTGRNVSVLRDRFLFSVVLRNCHSLTSVRIVGVKTIP